MTEIIFESVSDYRTVSIFIYLVLNCEHFVPDLMKHLIFLAPDLYLLSILSQLYFDASTVL